MKKNAFRLYYLLSVSCVLAASCYPLWMGVRVITDMIKNGTVIAAEYPKYIIPYTPISLAVIVGVLLMPLFFWLCRRFAWLSASALSLGVFFLSELLLETKVIVTESVSTTLANWQMVMCYVPPEGYGTRTWKAVDILIGDYSPAFKLHFYLISVVLIFTILNALYGFAQMIRNRDHSRQKALILQSVCAALFLGLCILACFTAFFRDGELTVSVLSALLMGLFFILLGVTAGIYIGSFLLGRKRLISVWLPTLTAAFVTLMMYIGETFLLSGHLYRFGSGFFFDGLPGIILAPVDILIVLLTGGMTVLLCHHLNRT